MITSADALSLIRKKFKEDPQSGMELAKQFQTIRQDPSSQFYAPYASGKSNYTELTSLFGVDRFDDDFFVKNTGLTQYLRYGAAGTPLAPTKKSSAQEIAAYQFYRVQKSDEPTRKLEDQWRELQRELAEKVNIFGMDDDSIIQSIDWGKYDALKDYEQNVKIRNVPMLTRPVSFSEDSVYGVLAAVRKGDKVGQTDRDYLPELADYYENKTAQAQMNIQPNANKKGLPGYVAPASASGSAEMPTVPTVENQPVSIDAQLSPTPTFTATTPGNQAAKTEEELDTVYAQQEKERQNKIDFSNLQYKMFTGQPLTDDEKKRWTELYPTQGHGKPGASIPAGLRLSSSGGGSALTIEQQNNAWMEKYTGFVRELYGESLAGNQSVLKQLTDLRYAADTIGMTVDQYLSDVVGERPQWLGELDYKQRLKDNPESITRLRPIEEVLADYRAGNELSEAEREMIWMYDTKHPGLLGGLKQVRAADISIPMDTRRNLGETAYAALSAADSNNMTPEESNTLILSIGQDMDASFGRYSTLDDYYASNPKRSAELQAFVDEEKARTEEAAAIKAAQDADGAKQAQQYAMKTLASYAKGEALDDNQKQFIAEIKGMPVTDSDYSDPAYVRAEDSLMNLSFDDLVSKDKTYAQYTDVTVSVEIKRTALDALDTDIRIAKSAGLTLSQMYEMFPEMRKDPYEMMDYARKSVEQKWTVDDPASVFGWLFGVNEKDLTGEGVGTGTALLKGSESGGLQFAQGYTGFVRNYFTETDEGTVQAWNRKRYGGPMGRVAAKKDFSKSIEGIADPEQKTYWQNYTNRVKDIYDLPFNFSDQAMLNALYNNKKALKQIESFMLSNATPAEYGAFMVTSSLVDNSLSMGTALATTALTGNPTVGTAIAFGPRSAYDASETARAAGLPQFARNGIGLFAGAITTLTEQIALTGLQNSATAMRGSLNLMKTAAMNGGAGFFKKLGAKIAFGTATIGVKFAENVAEQGSQEFVESVFTDVWLNLTGAQNKGVGAMFEDGVREGVMAAILTPFLSGQAYLFTAKGKVPITPDMQAAAQKFLDARFAESLQNPGTVAKIIEANAADQIINTLANGLLADVDTSVVEQTAQAVQKAQTDLQTATDAHAAKRAEYADKMQQYVENGTVMPDTEHQALVKALETTKGAYQTASRLLTALNSKFQQAQAVVGKQIASIIQTARAEASTKAQADILSEIAARNMAKADQVAEAQTISNPVERAQMLQDRLSGVQDRVEGLSDQQQQAASDVQAAIDQEQTPVTTDQTATQTDTVQAMQNTQPFEQAATQSAPEGVSPANVPATNEGLYEAATGQETQTDVQNQGKAVEGKESAFVTETLPKNQNLNQEQKDLVSAYRYVPVTNDAQVDRANETISTKGYQETVNEVLSDTFDPNTPDAQALMQVVITQAAQKNDVGNLSNVLFKYAKVGTDYAQVMQARTIMNRLSPEGFLSHVVSGAANESKSETKGWSKEKLDSFNKEVEQVASFGSYQAIEDELRLGKPNIKHYNRATIKQRMEAAVQYAIDNNGDIGKLAKDLVMIRQGLPVVTNADLAYINDQMKAAREFEERKKQATNPKDAATFEREHNLALNRAYEANANIYAVTLGDKFVSFLKTNMLANAKTNIRNISSNLLFTPMESITQYVGAALDAAVSKMRGTNRTVSAITPKDVLVYARNFYNETVNTYKDYMVDKVDTSKAEIERELHSKQSRTYQNPILELYKNMTSFALALGDRPFWAAKFHTSIYQQQRMNGMDVVTQEMIDTATSEANYAVFQEDNRLAKALSSLKQQLKGAGIILDWLVPFTKTPTNIAKRMFEYSPFNIIKALGWDMVHDIKKGKFDQKKFVMDMARGITGTGMMLIGAALRHSKLLRPGDDDEPIYDLIYLERAAGSQPENTIKVGDRSYTISSFQPFSTPLLLGASLYDTFGTNESFWSAFANGMVQSGDTLLEATFLQNLAALFGGEGDSITEKAAASISGAAVSQMVPSLLRQTANALDAYARDTNDTNPDAFKRSIMKILKKNLISNIPGWRNTLPVQVEITGEPVKSISGIFDNYINPAYVTPDKNDAALDELVRLAYVSISEGSSLSFLPSDDLYGSKNAIPNGARPLSEEEKVSYKIRKGTLLFDGGRTIDKSGAAVTMSGLRALMASDTYKRMSDQQKADAVNGQVDAANAGVNAEYLKIVGVIVKEKSSEYTPKAATTVPVYFTDNNPWYMKQLNKLYDQTGDAAYLPTSIGTTFSRTVNKQQKEYTVPQDKTDVFYKLYDAELSKRLANLDWNLTGQELAEKVKKAISDAQGDVKDKWVKEGYWK